MTRAVHLDNSSTTWPKPPEVAEAMRDWFERLGCDASRGGSSRHSEVRGRVRELRARLAELCGVPQPHVVLGSGATEMMNLVLKGLIQDGDHVWCTGLEHNAVLRPLVRMREQGRILLRSFSGPQGACDEDELLEALTEGPLPRVFVLNHASNVTGEIQEPQRAIAALRERGVRVVLDCAQSIGRIPVAHVGADAYVVPGHKALMGPPGVGALCLREDLGLRPWKEGGTGEGREHMPEGLPQAYESGTPNTPGYLGWLAGIEWLLERGPESILTHERELMRQFRAALQPALDERVLDLRGGEDDGLAIVSLTSSEFECHELAALLEDEGYVTRSGLQCAPWVHDCLPSKGAGSVRVSPGPFNTHEEIAGLAALLLELHGLV